MEGNSLRAIARTTGVSKVTVLKLLKDIGKVCAEYQDQIFRNLTCHRLQADEIWSFVYCKDKNVPNKQKGKLGKGSVYTWVAMDADTKLVPSWYVGLHDLPTAIKL